MPRVDLDVLTAAMLAAGQDAPDVAAGLAEMRAAVDELAVARRFVDAAVNKHHHQPTPRHEQDPALPVCEPCAELFALYEVRGEPVERVRVVPSRAKRGHR